VVKTKRGDVKELELRHDMDCDADAYFEKCVLSEDYNRRLFLEGLKFPSFKLIEQKEEGTTVFRKALVEPTLAGLPGPLKKVIGDSMSYIEEGTYDRTTKRYRFSTIPTGGMKDKVKTTGEMYCEHKGDKKCVRVAKLRVDVNLRLIGGLLEDRIVTDLKSSYAKAAEFTSLYAKEKGF
jgi:hypothetical protein